MPTLNLNIIRFSSNTNVESTHHFFQLQMTVPYFHYSLPRTMKVSHYGFEKETGHQISLLVQYPGQREEILMLKEVHCVVTVCVVLLTWPLNRRELNLLLTVLTFLVVFLILI